MDNNQLSNPSGQEAVIPPDVRIFLENILKDGNIMVVDDEMREEMIKELYLELDNFLTAKIVDNLPADKLEEFIRMNEEKKPRTEIEQFFKTQIPNVQEMMTNAFLEFREEYLGNVAVERNAPSNSN